MVSGGGLCPSHDVFKVRVWRPFWEDMDGVAGGLLIRGEKWRPR